MMMMKNLALVCALALVSMITAESDESYAMRKQPALRMTKPLPRLMTCNRCLRQCLFDDDDDAVADDDDDAVMNIKNVADVANEKFDTLPRINCRQCINRCGRQMCARMGLKRIADRSDGYAEANGEAKTEWGWGFGSPFGFGGWGWGWGW